MRFKVKGKIFLNGIKFKRVTFFLLAVTVIFFLSCNEKKLNVSRILLGTVVTFVINGDVSISSGAAENAFDEVKRIQELFSVYDNKTDVSKLNRLAENKKVKVQDEVFDLIKQSCEISRDTDGAFDITFASVSHLWKFKGDTFTPPAKKDVKRLMPLLDYRNILLDYDDKTVRLKKIGMKVGLGGIAKGYAIGRAVDILKKWGIKSALVDAGGDIQVIGDSSGRSWVAGLRHPRKNGIIGSIKLCDMDSIATSGDYERFAFFRSKRYHHIIDTSTGYPANSGLISVSVISKDAVKSDAYATAFFVMGLKECRKYLKKREVLSVILIDENLKIYVSATLKNRVTFLERLDVEFI